MDFDDQVTPVEHEDEGPVVLATVPAVQVESTGSRDQAKPAGRICARCLIRNSKSEFSKNQLRYGKKAICINCLSVK